MVVKPPIWSQFDQKEALLRIIKDKLGLLNTTFDIPLPECINACMSKLYQMTMHDSLKPAKTSLFENIHKQE